MIITANTLNKANNKGLITVQFLRISLQSHLNAQYEPAYAKKAVAIVAQPNAESPLIGCLLSDKGSRGHGELMQRDDALGIRHRILCTSVLKR